MPRNLLVAHGGGPTAVMNAALYGLLCESQTDGRVGHVIGARHGISGVLAEDFVDLLGQPQALLEALPDIPSSVLGSCRRKLTPDDYETIVRVFRRYDVGYFVYQGGNDSMDTARKIHELGQSEKQGFRVLGLPKTVDNDLAETDHCPGFGSAARFYAQLMRDMDIDNRALPSPVAVVEVMGRNAGWLTAASALAREEPDQAPHLIYVPERPFDEHRFLENVQEVCQTFGRAVVAVSEGVVWADGTPVCASVRPADVDGFGHPLPGNVSKYLADLLSERAGLRARNLKPDLWGRTCALLQSRVDREESIALGRRAVREVLDGRSGVMLTLVRISNEPYEFDIGRVDLEKVANVERRVPDCYLTDDGLGVTQAFRDYALPLIGGRIPTYPRLSDVPIIREDLASGRAVASETAGA